MRDFLKDVEQGKATSPEASAQEKMRPQRLKRFYKEVSVEAVDENFTVLLDGRSIKTPGKNQILFQTKKAAELFAEEWEKQVDEINPLEMPITRIVNTAIDGVSLDPQAVLEDVVKFAASDLLCYRVTEPEKLVTLQRERWDPILDWVFEAIGAHFELGEGIVHVVQPTQSIAKFSAHISKFNEPMILACLHTCTTLSGSSLIAVALFDKFLDVDSAWKAAHLDEDFNISQWGEDYEAAKRREQRFKEFQAAYEFFKAL